MKSGELIGGGDVNHVVRNHDVFTAAEVFEDGFPGLSTELHQVVAKHGFDVLSLNNLFQSRPVMRDSEDGPPRRGEDDAGGVPGAVPPEVVLREIADLLRSTSAFNGS